MSRNLPVDELLSWARREGDAVRVGLRLPGVDLAPGRAVVRLTRRNAERRIDAELVRESDAVALAFTVPQATLSRTPWAVAVQASGEGRFQPVEARLLNREGQPVAVLPGPAPDTKMPPPAPRVPGRGGGPPPAATRSRRALRRGRNLARKTLGAARRTAGRAARRAKRRVSGGLGPGESARRGGRRPGRRPDVPPAPRLQGRALRAVLDADKRPVVVLTDVSTERAVAAWLPSLPDADVTILRLAPAGSSSATAAAVVDVSGLDDAERRLFPIGQPGALVVALSPASLDALDVDHRQLLARLFPHLGHGGAYVAHAVPTGDPSSRNAGDGTLAAFRRTLVRAAVAESSSKPASDLQALGVREVVETPGSVVLKKNRRHALKLREEQVGDLLPAREPGTKVSILEARPAGSLQVAAIEIAHGPRRGEPWPDRLRYPEMTLRHYRGELMSRGSMLLTTDSTVLPESFRWPHGEQLGNATLHAVSPHFSRAPRISDAPLLEGDYYFLDCPFSGHFGHLLTEVVCRLWGWEAARRELPDLKALFHTDPRRGRHGSLERKIFAAYGVPDADIVGTDRPVRVRSVVGASPMWHNAPPFYVHPDLQDVWSRLSFGLLDGRPPAEHERIFVSRGDDLGRRRCRNQAEVEQFFANRGFHLFYPEKLPLDEQVALFAGARTVAGFAGSAMFNMMHCRRLETSIVMSQNGYVARNENLFTSLLGGELHYFWQDSDTPQARLGSKEARRASYAFDFDKYGAELAQVIDAS